MNQQMGCLKMNEKNTYEIVEKGKAIKCLVCNLTSWNKNDVKEKYCGGCHQYHKILKTIRTILKP